MISVFGSNITNAYTNGVSVKAIYTNGVKVWPEGYYIRWWPSTATGRFTIDGSTYYWMGDYSGYFSWSTGILKFPGFIENNQITGIETNAHTIEQQTFEDCSNLQSVRLLSCVSLSSFVFDHCSLADIYLPVTKYIGSGCFQGTGSRGTIQSVYLPVCEHLGAVVFAYNSMLSAITFGASVVCEEDTFMGNYEHFYNTQITSSTGSIYVPASLVDAYKNTDCWKSYSQRIYPIEP